MATCLPFGYNAEEEKAGYYRNSICEVMRSVEFVLGQIGVLGESRLFLTWPVEHRLGFPHEAADQTLVLGTPRRNSFGDPTTSSM